MKEFRLDKDHFMQQLRELQRAGDEYTEAKGDLNDALSDGCDDLQSTGVCSASGDGGSRWSRVSSKKRSPTCGLLWTPSNIATRLNAISSSIFSTILVGNLPTPSPNP